MKQKFASAFSLALIVAMLFTSVGLADNVQNDVVAGGNDTFTLSGSTTLHYLIASNNGDGETGCNATTSSPATVMINTPSGLTATPSSLVFTSCGTSQSVVFTATSIGTYNTTVSVSDSGAGSYNVNPGKATLYVQADPPPSNTMPTVIVTNVTNGESYNKGSVPVAGCSVTDFEDGPSSFGASLSAITGTYASDGLGSQTATCSYIDNGGLTASATATYFIVDPFAPSIGYVLNPPSPDGTNDWYKSDVSLTWTVTEDESPNSLVKIGCDDQNINLDQDVTTYSCSATSAGGSAGPVEVSIKRDGTLPTISGSRTPAANGNNWNNTNVTVSFTCDDDLSGVASCTPATTLSSEGAGQSVTGSALDKAGNTATTTVSGINIDKTTPTASATAAPGPNANGWNNTDVVVSFSGTDTLSGIDTCSAPETLSIEGANQSASGTCTDKAGNESAPASASASIDKTAPSVSLVGGPTDGGTYYFGFVPAAPTCNASDALSGLAAPCSVDGYYSTLGSHTVTASATDKAGNSASASATYTVLEWTLKGFYAPVDMGGVVNTVKNGSTVPLKFEIFAGDTELMLTSYVKSLNYTATSCSSLPTDDIELTATGQTALRYDTTSGQYIFNWQTPKTAGACYKVTMTTQDGSFLSALFKLK